MKLSEAIRAGAKLGPQAFGSLEKKRGFLGLFKRREYCALGGAFAVTDSPRRTVTVAVGESFSSFRGEARRVQAGETTTYIKHQFGDALQICTPCPFCGGTSEPLRRLIPHLNDQHRLSREDIAGFVAQLEDMTAQAFTTIQVEREPAPELPAVDAEFVAELKADLVREPIAVGED